MKKILCLKKEGMVSKMRKVSKNKGIKSQGGITLIALVITIVLNAIAWSKEIKNLLKYEKTLANTANPL